MVDFSAVATPFLVLALLLALAALITGARFFTAAAERVGLAFGMSPFTVGVFIVAIGTSLPELVSSLVAVTHARSEVVSGNVLGANTALLLLVLGVVAAISRRGIQLGERYIAIDLNFMLGSAALLALVMHDGTIGRIEGLLLLVCYGVYSVYQVTEGRTATATDAFDASLPGPAKSGLRWRDLLWLAVGGGLIFVAADTVLHALIEVAARIGISPALASLTILSLGTALPELVVSVAAALAGRAEMAIGNILGSCIFNALGVAGIAASVDRVAVPQELLRLPLPAFAGAAILFYLLTSDRRVSRSEGWLFVLAYGLLVAELAGIA